MRIKKDFEILRERIVEFPSGLAKPIGSAVGLLSFLLFAIILTANSTRAEQLEMVSIPVIVPLSGNGADQGEWVRKGVELAAKEINSGSKLRVRLVFEDSQGLPKSAVSLYRSLKAREKFPAVITWGSGVGLALTPLVNADKIIQFGVATASPDYSSLDDYTFRNFPSAEHESNFIVKFLRNKLDVEQAAVLKLNNDYGLGSARTFREKFESSGGQIVFEDAIEPGANDFRTQLLKLKKSNAAVVYLATYPLEGALVLKQALELDYAPQFVASVAILGQKEFFSVAGKAAEGLMVSTSTPPDGFSKNPQVRTFVEGFKKEFAETPTPQHVYAARAYDALHLIADAVATCGSMQPICLRDYLFDVQNYPGASATVSFDRYGDVRTDFSMQRVVGGKFVSALRETAH